MGLLEKIFGKRRPVRDDGYFQSFTTYTPAFRTWDGKLYESELVRAAVDAKARHISKLRVELRGSAQPKLQTRIRMQPNDFQTWGQFLYRLSTSLDMQNTAFIVPIYDEFGDKCGVFPLVPSSCEVVEVRGEAWLRYTFQNGEKAAERLDRCGVMIKHQYENDFFGEKNTALTDTMRLMNVHSQAVNEAFKNSNTFRFMAQINNFLSPEDLARERKRFTKQNLSGGGGGLLLFPNTYKDIRQVSNTPYTVDAEQIKLIQNNVFNYFGVSAEVLNNSADETKLDAFFNGSIEPFSIQLSDVLTKMLFTKNERAYGAAVLVTSNRLSYMSTSNKVIMARDLGDRGVLMIDEIRELFNYEPLPDGAGQHAPIRGEYYMVDEGKNPSEQGNGKQELVKDGGKNAKEK